MAIASPKPNTQPRAVNDTALAITTIAARSVGSGLRPVDSTRRRADIKAATITRMLISNPRSTSAPAGMAASNPVGS